jgi:hypothetical protein
MAQSSAIRDIQEISREDGYTDIIVTTEQGHTAVESYYLDCDRENRLQSAIDSAFDKDSDD